jgi:tetratricopeptide (TPR) repeat protein
MDAAKLSREIMGLNNDSLVYLQMNDPLEAYKLLTEAISLLPKLVESPRPSQSRTFTQHKQYQYDWVDCISERMELDKDDSKGRIEYLFLRALKLSTSASSILYEHKTSTRGAEDNDDSDGDEDEDFYDFLGEDAGWDDSSRRDGDSAYHSCPSGRVAAWVVYFNLAITCNILGSQKARGGTGRLCYIEQAYHMYEAAKDLIIEEMGPSKNWSTLLMAVFNNQSCIYHEYAMYDESTACMERVRQLLARSPFTYRCIGSDWQVFCLNLLLLQQKPKLASAA